MKESIGGPVGSLIVLRPWQRELLDRLLAERPDGRLASRQALIGLPRKSGKSALLSSLALWSLFLGPEGGETYSVAGDREQARITFGTGRRMVELDRELSSKTKLYRDAIEVPSTGSVWRVVSSDAPLKEGLSPTFTLVDEVHVIDEQLWNVFALAQGARPEPMMVGITTAGVRTDSTGEPSLCYRLFDHGLRTATGEIEDPTYFFAWWGAQDAADHRDPEVWRAANPGFGDIVAAEDFESAVMRTPENEFRTKRLNQWVGAEHAWLPEGAWDACQDGTLELDKKLPIHVGIDISLRNDATAVVACQRQGDRIIVRSRVWENPYAPTDGEFHHWRVDHGEVERHLRDLYAAFPVPAADVDGRRLPGPEFSFDPAYFSDAARRLSGDGLAMVEFPQTDSRMIPACQGLFELISNRTIAHDGDPALGRHLANAHAKETGRGWRLTKPRGSRAKIDAAIALSIGAHRAQQAVPKPRGVGAFVA